MINLKIILEKWLMKAIKSSLNTGYLGKNESSVDNIRFELFKMIMKESFDNVENAEKVVS
jgi:hypothetical protein